MNNNVPYNIFSKWYKYTRRKVIEVQVQGRPNQKELSGEDVQGEKPVKKTDSGSDNTRKAEQTDKKLLKGHRYTLLYLYKKANLLDKKLG